MHLKANFWRPEALYSNIMRITWRLNQNQKLLEKLDPRLASIIKQTMAVRKNNDYVRSLSPAPPKVILFKYKMPRTKFHPHPEM